VKDQRPQTDAPFVVRDGIRIMTEAEVTDAARQVWPEAEGFEAIPGGWTFRVGAGYASVTNTGQVATDPQGTRRHAERFMPAFDRERWAAGS